MISCYLSSSALFEPVSLSQSWFSAFPISGKWIFGLTLGGTVTVTGSGSGCERIDWICGGSCAFACILGGFGRMGEFSGRFLGFLGAFLLDSELIDAFLGRIFAEFVAELWFVFWAFLKKSVNCRYKASGLTVAFFVLFQLLGDQFRAEQKEQQRELAHDFRSWFGK